MPSKALISCEVSNSAQTATYLLIPPFSFCELVVLRSIFDVLPLFLVQWQE